MRPRLAGLAPLLAVAVVLLLLGSVVGTTLVNARQDPTLQVPAEVRSATPAPADDGLAPPEAPDPAGG